MIPFIVRAHLVNGYVTNDPWAPAVDGIIAYAAKMLEHGPEKFALTATRTSEMLPVEGLPLHVIAHDGLWWYAASCPIADVIGRERKYYNRRFDDFQATDRLPQTKKVLTAAGPHKAGRMHEQRILARHVDWHCLGDPDACMRLLDTLPDPSIGAGRGRGHGRVARWEILPGDGETVDLAMYHRPLPVSYAAEKGVHGPVVLAGFRPPARIPQNNARCVMPPRTGDGLRAAA